MIPATSPINDIQCISAHCTDDCMLCAFQNEFQNESTTDLSAAIAEAIAGGVAGINWPWPVFVALDESVVRALEARGIIVEE